MGYAILQDVYDLGLTAQAFVVRPRSLDVRAGDALDFATGTFRLLAHGLTATDLVHLVLLGAGTVPAGATANTPYSPLPLDFYRFRLAAAPDGSALTYSTAGTGAWAIQLDPERRLQRHIDDAAARIDECLTAQRPPLLVDPTTGKYPTQIIGLNARMAARSSYPTLQFENAAFRTATDRIFAMEKADDLTLADWKAGKPLNPTVTDQNMVPDDAARATNGIVAGRICDMSWVTGYL